MWCLMPALLLFGKPRQAGRQAFKTILSSRVRLYLKTDMAREVAQQVRGHLEFTV